MISDLMVFYLLLTFEPLIGSMFSDREKGKKLDEKN